MLSALQKAVVIWGMAIGFLPLSALAEIETATASMQDLPQERVLDGKIEAVHEATVSAQTSGRVIDINYDVDDYVEKGSVLLQFRDTEQRARHNSAKASYEEALSEYQRVKDIYAKKLVAKAALDKAEARLKSTKAGLEQATEELENTRVRAPYSGIVVKRHIEVGELARVGQPLFTGISLEELRASVEIPQEMIMVVRKHQQARVIFDQDGKQSVAAESLRISPYADPESHTFNVRVNLPKGDHGVYPGMFVKVAFVVGEVQQLVVPLRAVVHRSEVTAVYVVDANNRIQMRQIRIGSQVKGDKVEVLAGLSEGEEVALDPVMATASYKEQQSGSEQ